MLEEPDELLEELLELDELELELEDDELEELLELVELLELEELLELDELLELVTAPLDELLLEVPSSSVPPHAASDKTATNTHKRLYISLSTIFVFCLDFYAAGGHLESAL